MTATDKFPLQTQKQPLSTQPTATFGQQSPPGTSEMQVRVRRSFMAAEDGSPNWRSSSTPKQSCLGDCTQVLGRQKCVFQSILGE